MNDTYIQPLVALAQLVLSATVILAKKKTQKIMAGAMLAVIPLAWWFGVSKSQIDTRVCGDIAVSAIPNQSTIDYPAQEGAWVPIEYRIKAPSQSGITLLLHSAEQLVQTGAQPISIAEGAQATHYGLSILANATESITDDGVWLTTEDAKEANSMHSNLIIDRRTFHIVTDNGVYCTKAVDVALAFTE